jgi:hypothetical protein
MTMIRIDDTGVKRELCNGFESVRWGDLIGVAIMTTADGPFSEDFFWILVGADGKGCVVPGEHAADLLQRLQRLPGFDNQAVIDASTSTEEATFSCWRGNAGEGVVAGGGEQGNAQNSKPSI